MTAPPSAAFPWQTQGAGTAVPVRHVDPRSDPLWLELASGPSGCLFTSPPWIEAVCDTYRLTPAARILTHPSGRPRAGLTWVDVDDALGRRRVTLPFSDRADPVADDAAAWLAVAADAFVEDLPLSLRCLDTSLAVADPRWVSVDEAAWHATLLDRPLAEVRAAFRGERRRNIATAERSGVEIVLSTTPEAVRQLHRLHVELRKRKYRMLAQPREFFERIWDAFAPSDGIRTALALVDGRPVAGAMYLVWQDTAYYKFGASREDFLHLRPNDAIHWQMIRWAHEHGLRMLDWGLSDLDQPGLCRYKRGWASAEGRIRKLSTRTPQDETRHHTEALLGEVTELLTDPSVPDEVTERAGARLYHLFC